MKNIIARDLDVQYSVQVVLVKKYNNADDVQRVEGEYIHGRFII
jgi:hypothetical protein